MHPDPPEPPEPSSPLGLGSAARALGDADLAARLERWAADARVAEAARRRSRERWLRQQAEEAATFAGVLTDLAESGTPVGVQTLAGRRYQGTVRTVGVDFVAIEGTRGAVLVASSVLVSVRTRPGAAAAVGVRSSAGRSRLSEVLVGMAAEGEPVVLVPRHGGDPVAGTLVAVGRDVVVVRASGERPAIMYVPLVAVGEVVIES